MIPVHSLFGAGIIQALLVWLAAPNALAVKLNDLVVEKAAAGWLPRISHVDTVIYTNSQCGMAYGFPPTKGF